MLLLSCQETVTSFCAALIDVDKTVGAGGTPKPTIFSVAEAVEILTALLEGQSILDFTR